MSDKIFYKYTFISGAVLGLLATGGYSASANQRGQINESAHSSVKTVMRQQMPSTRFFSSNQFGQENQEKARQPQQAVVSPSTTAKYHRILKGMNHYYDARSNQEKKDSNTSLSRFYIKKYLAPRFSKNIKNNIKNKKSFRSQVRAKSAAHHRNSTQSTAQEKIAFSHLLSFLGSTGSFSQLSQTKIHHRVHSNKVTNRGKRPFKIVSASPSHQRRVARNKDFLLEAISAQIKQPNVNENSQKSSDSRVSTGIGQEVNKIGSSVSDWFRDGLDDAELAARNWITVRESGNHWNIPSYGGHCIGYFQLSPGYLGYVNGQLNLDPRHQVAVADKYVQSRYGDWLAAKNFWLAHKWY